MAAEKLPTDLAMTLPASLRAERQGAVAILRLARPHKRNALNDANRRRHRDLLRRIAGRHRRRTARRRRRAFFRRPRPWRTCRTRHHPGHRAFPVLAWRLREDPVRQGANGRRAARRGGRRRARTRRRRACARGGTLGLLRAAGRQPRHLRRRRRIGAAAAAHWCCPNDGHDAHRPHLFGRGRPDHGAVHLSGRNWVSVSPRAWNWQRASPTTRR